MANRSFEQIHYGLRPLKGVERKLLGEVFRKGEAFGPISEARYVGFGSVFFIDFVHFHRTLGIKQMLSIEKAPVEPRLDFNRPYDCIEIRMGESQDVLPTLDWLPRSIVWLDYDGPLSESVLGDVSTCCERLQSGSFLAVTVNARPPGNNKSDVKVMIERIGPHCPQELDPKEVTVWQTAELYARILKGRVDAALVSRNAGVPGPGRLRAELAAHFQYQDGAKMLTLAWFLHSEEDAELADGADFCSLEFVRDDGGPFRIGVPILTHRELRHLDAQLPGAAQSLASPGLADDALGTYSKVYRYYPRYVEADL